MAHERTVMRQKSKPLLKQEQYGRQRSIRKLVGQDIKTKMRSLLCPRLLPPRKRRQGSRSAAARVSILWTGQSETPATVTSCEGHGDVIG